MRNDELLVPEPSLSTMERKPPRVSLGMPVYNGENFLANAIQSVLSQSFGDLELLISDNASTDRTAEICEEYALRDSRVRYFRNPENVGLVNNHNLLVQHAAGEYFMWVAHDDALHPDYLARCVDLLDRNPDAALCFTKTANIGVDGLPLALELDPHRTVSPFETHALDPRLRYRDILRLHHACEPVYGVIRSSFLKQTRLHGKYADSDRVFLAELALRGRFLMIPDPLFVHREHEQRSVHAYPSRQARTLLMDPSLAGRIVFPYWRELFEFCVSIHRSPIPARKRLACYWETLCWMRNYQKFLRSDLYVAALELARKTLPKSARRTIKRLLFRSSANS
jgi:glycosyltransferase involved in cell wall biosynthesis